jgi:hypothetical protein
MKGSERKAKSNDGTTVTRLIGEMVPLLHRMPPAMALQ